MDNSFYIANRRSLYARLEKGALAIVHSGAAPRKTNDEYYPFFTDRNFIYLTGIEQDNAVLLGIGGDGGGLGETLFIPPPDLMLERWNGRRVKADEASGISGIQDIKHTPDFDRQLDRFLASGAHDIVYLPLFKYTSDEPDGPAYRLARYIRDRFPHVVIKDLLPHIKALRLIKKPCEIEAMRKAEAVTGEGILAMMKAARPGIMEYELKAELEYAFMKHGVLPASPPIISAGENNFCIHYNAFRGCADDGDLVLNDVGAKWDSVMTDVSRAWPVNGRFSERQRILYQCAYDTSEHLFSIIKPGMPMRDVDGIIRKYNFERMRDAGVCKSWDEIGTYMWHGGAHHVGFDVHDVVAVAPDTPLAPGMVFCVDIGIYHMEWGIGFRLEDNCLITESGCENLSKDIPRSIEEIESVFN
ncbi:MAG: Xaa-Pro peptidase family protein [Defluviitaleaceae bacterium]|nr:Xaa-Pro peptidase family protein [Defluviitaleaceae bacterium]MCL2835106.1 Xaa-Pro peptidase family protein [Defluviitaleaceae bacterium]